MRWHSLKAATAVVVLSLPRCGGFLGNDQIRRCFSLMNGNAKAVSRRYGGGHLLESKRIKGFDAGCSPGRYHPKRDPDYQGHKKRGAQDPAGRAHVEGGIE